jgi:putative ABC transport system substrate-binding protein
MWPIAKRLSRGIVLIAAAAGVLLATDVRRPGHGPRIAILQHTSTSVLDDGVRGMIDGLAENGYRDGEAAEITTYNAQGDMATATAIAREITDGRYDLVLTSSTPSMQAVANANKAGRTLHVFGLVADPFSADVGLDPNNPLHHPRHLVGYGIRLPAGEAFRMARRVFPGLKAVGAAWNPAEANSRMFLGMARAACQELGIELLEANVESSAGVREAINSLIGRGAQAVWVGGDNTVNSAQDTVLLAARPARIPVFSISPGDPERGTLFDLGLDFYEAGRLCGVLAAEILHGADPAQIPIRDSVDVVPHRLIINLRVLNGLKDPWRFPTDLVQQADIVVDESGVHTKRH